MAGKPKSRIDIPVHRGYQPSPQKPATSDNVQGGYQPATSEGKPQTTNPPPKNP